MPLDRDYESVDENILGALLYNTSAGPNNFGLHLAENEKDDKRFEPAFDWCKQLPVPQFGEISLRRHSKITGGDFLVLVLCDLSLCCVGSESSWHDDSLSLPVPLCNEQGQPKITTYPQSYMPKLDVISSTLVKVCFSHQPRDLIELLKILRCVGKHITQPSDLNAWVTLVIFARTFCDWELRADKHVHWDVVVRSALGTGIADTVTPSLVKHPSDRPMGLPQKEKQSRPGDFKPLYNALVSEWDSVKETMAGTCLHASLGDNIALSLASSVSISTRMSAICSARDAAKIAAQEAAQAVVTESLYDAAWEWTADLAGLEDDVVGRGALTYIADQSSDRGFPRQEHELAMSLMRTNTDASEPGWMNGFNIGWVYGWRAGQRAARLFVPDLRIGSPGLQWSDDQDAKWDRAWDSASKTDRTIPKPSLEFEVNGRAEYNSRWDTGWDAGWQLGHEVGWEHGREKAKCTTIRSWRHARTAAMRAAYGSLSTSMKAWSNGELCTASQSIEATRLKWAEKARDQAKTQGTSSLEELDLGLNEAWQRAWGDGPPHLASACAHIASQIVEHVHQTVYAPDIFVYSTDKSDQVDSKSGYAHLMFQSSAIGHISSYLNHEAKEKGDSHAVVPARSLVEAVWVDLIENLMR